MKHWHQIFRALANINRLKIIKLLSRGEKLSVSAIARELKISLKSTSKHLIILENLNFLDQIGRNNRVYYFLNHQIPKDVQKAIKLFT